MEVEIKGTLHEIIEEDGILVYKDHFCGCPCQRRIHYPIYRALLYIHKKNGVPKFIKGHSTKVNNYMEGKKHRPETLEKMKESHKKFLKEHPEWCESQSKRMYSDNNPFWNRQHSIESKKKISEAMVKWNQEHPKISYERLKKYYENNPTARKTGKDNYMYGRIHPNRGKKLSIEACQKMSDNHADVSGKNNPMYGKPTRSKRCYYNSQFQGIVNFRSTYELKYAKYLDNKNIPWKYEDKTFELNNNKTYTPDFYLVNEEKYIEIKGYLRQKSKEKILLFKQQYPNIKFDILYTEDLIKIGILI